MCYCCSVLQCIDVILQGSYGNLIQEVFNDDKISRGSDDVIGALWLANKSLGKLH